MVSVIYIYGSLWIPAFADITAAALTGFLNLKLNGVLSGFSENAFLTETILFMEDILSAFFKGFIPGIIIIFAINLFLYIAFKKKPIPDAPEEPPQVKDEKEAFIKMRNFISSTGFIKILAALFLTAVVFLYCIYFGSPGYNGVITDKRYDTGGRVRKWRLKHSSYFITANKGNYKISYNAYNDCNKGDRIRRSFCAPGLYLNDKYYADDENLWNFGFVLAVIAGITGLILILKKTVVNIIDAEILHKA